MFVCGVNFVGGVLACAVVPTNVSNINYMELKNGIYDDLYATRAINFDPTAQYSTEWNFETILYAQFNDSDNAGNVDWNTETTSHIILKSRDDEEFLWKTICVKEIRSAADFCINYSDYFVASGQTLEYAIVNVLHGQEGNYVTTKITPKFSKLFLIENDIVWSTDITDGYCNTTRNISSANVEPLKNRRPVFIRNGAANYDTGTCGGSFVPFVENSGCQFAYGVEHDYQRTRYQRKFVDFLCNGVPKILKMPDGRIWIIQVTPSPTDNAKQSYNDREISWPWVEIGDINSEEDLYYLGLSDVSPEWWNT